MIPQCTIAAYTVLQFCSRFQCFFFVCRIFFGFAARGRINLFQLRNGERSFLRIFSFIAVIEVNQLRLTLFHLCDDQAHLKSPVTQMHIADHLMSYKAADPLYTLTDDCRTQMTNMKRFCNIGSAVIYHDRLRLFGFFDGQILVSLHLQHIVCQIAAGNLHINKARIHCFDRLKHRIILQLRHNIIRNHDRCFFVLFGSCHCTITLILTKVRTVGNTGSSVCCIIAACFKRIHNFLTDQI